MRIDCGQLEVQFLLAHIPKMHFVRLVQKTSVRLSWHGLPACECNHPDKAGGPCYLRFADGDTNFLNGPKAAP